MKNIYLLLTAIALPSTGFSQIKINALDFADANDTVRLSMALMADANEMAINGANVTWDFSNLNPTSQRLEKFDAPSSFVSPFNLLFNSFNTSFGKVNALFSNLNLMVLTIEKAYDFQRKTSEFYHQVGTGLTINGTPVPFSYSAKDVIHLFPVEYQDEDSCNFQFGTGLPSLGYYGQSGKRVNIADGWGKITTPYGTFDVLRILSKVDITDTIYVDQFSFGTKFNRPTSYQYKWFTKTEKLPILEIVGSYQGGTFIPTSVVYRDIYRPEVNQLSTQENELASSVSIFPNPAKTILSVASPKAAIENYSVLDISGKVVLAGNAALQNEISISVENLTSGIYIFYATTQKGAIIQKFIKE